MAELLGPTLAQPGALGTNLGEIHREATTCRRCNLYKHATQLVFGEGPTSAKVVFVGEQPGDKEDLAGQPFVGPAGKLLDRCLEEAGIERDACYVTNAVKHFKFEPRGKRRIHAKPTRGEVQICAWWLAAELRLIRPKLVVALGATAVYSLLGPQAKVTRDRGSVLRSPAGLYVFVTIHPSALLRMLDQPAGRQSRARFVDDLKAVATLLEHA
ncbi:MULTISPECIES: UdgX family uracil-DNA binding protein [Rhizobium]|uniref:Type-4 uracil-DNA glycosylase n=1 Tax=Rhizobium favelukesii TaxID=348824 RepID=W6RS66_9HYPH|nr:MULTISPECIES: UdgX family uracil-DNA binding protein [Rhizobium]MCS0462527.1 UdgX family uracil-DNA binding protein [Rhizobium favelukesii]UFS79414.1 UdgX family uracil-DNA binding protein [Rhizobium sp. T136]CDM62980.1 phage SPO1 DNA polymerase-like protein [Rhizobium favelukesii]